ncbi:hypothetical protein GJ496_007366 [Pomphorhynchus laevis]|nr:hypothetical protein GJ496_007366 [Pomphorhynchus laevis]
MNKIIIYHILAISLTAGEKFFRTLLYPNKEHTDRDNRCWNSGSSLNDILGCDEFLVKPGYNDIYWLRKYMQSEIILICKQLWLRYDDNLKFCVRDDSYNDYMNKVPHDLPAYRTWLKRIDNATKKEVEEMDRYNHIECLKSGRTYDYYLKNCAFIKLNPMEKDKIKFINDILNEHVRYNFWCYICNHLGLRYDSNMRTCTRVHYFYDGSTLPVRIDVTFSGSKHDLYEKQLYCITIGLSYIELEDGCGEYKENNIILFIGGILAAQNNIQQVYIHAKEIFCARYGMLYQLQLDICYQTEEIPIVRSKRHVELCLDPGCKHNLSESEYGPNLRLLVSKKDDECFRLGQLYQKSYDRCENFPREMDENLLIAYQFRYFPHLHQILRRNCFRNSLDYSRNKRICITPKGNMYEIDRHSERHREYHKVHNLEDYRKLQLKICMFNGYDYDPYKDDCVCYPTIFTDDYYNFYKSYQSIQVHVVCDSSRRTYIPELDFCPTEKFDLKSLNQSDINLKRNHFESDRQKLVREFCYSKEFDYYPKLKLCIERFRKRSSIQKYTYEELARTYCMGIGKVYDEKHDACVSPVEYQAFKTKNVTHIKIDQILSMCELSNLEYDREFGFCVMRREPFERKIPKIPIILDGQDGYEECLRVGMLYINKTKSCQYFPLRITKTHVSTWEPSLELAIDKLYARFCSAGSKSYLPSLRMCRKKVSQVPLRNSTSFSNICKRDRYYCFMLGYRLVYRDKKYVCDEFPSNAMITKEHRFYRKMYIHHRCPIFSKYDDLVKFCIQIPPREFPIVHRKYFPKNLNQHYSKLTTNTALNANEQILHLSKKCCISKGLIYYQELDICITYRMVPTLVNSIRSELLMPI